MKDDGPKLGKIIEPGEHAVRDAVHIAVIPVTAEHDISPGTAVAVFHKPEVGWEAYSVIEGEVGIVDPFLKDNVKKGEKFWLFLLPNTVTSLRHYWTSPNFTNRVLDNT